MKAYFFGGLYFQIPDKVSEKTFNEVWLETLLETEIKALTAYINRCKEVSRMKRRGEGNIAGKLGVAESFVNQRVDVKQVRREKERYERVLEEFRGIA